jgi:hypothetical protein
MSARKDNLRRRREWLVSQAAAQRSEISCIALHMQKKLRWVDTGFAVGQALRAHPVLAVAGVALLMRVAKTRRLLWAGQLFTAWELFSVVRKQWPRRRI